ncbi:MAG: hypothetical protein B6I28_04660 [Fusobacteriia bacterium 4572_132]|nr:MAG: hypothetical protein B6I28_04660 [Fusobacteriia bacterium 4572_132]
MEEKVIRILKKYIDADLIYIFGSALNDRFNFDSDIDIAFLAHKTILSKKLMELKFELIKEMEREIDLIDLKDASLILTSEVIFKGKLIFKKDEKVKNEFEYRKIALYGQLLDDIKIVKDKIKERGYIRRGN